MNDCENRQNSAEDVTSAKKGTDGARQQAEARQTGPQAAEEPGKNADERPDEGRTAEEPGKNAGERQTEEQMQTEGRKTEEQQTAAAGEQAGARAGQENKAAGETSESAKENTVNDKECGNGEKPDKEGKEKGHCHRELQKAREEAEKWKTEAEDLKRKWYAVTAEYDNYRRRTQNQAAQKYAEGRSDVIAALFEIGDNLERALSACSDEKTRQGVEMVLKSYKKVLEGEGVEEFDPTGQTFDAAIAEAIMAVPAEAGETAGAVKQVHVKGYKRGDKILRYAQVIVTQ